MPSLPSSKFAGDLGDADLTLVSRLAAYAAGQASEASVIAALCRTRLLVPVVATARSVVQDGDDLAVEKDTDMEVVLFQRPTDGRTALLAFTSLDALRTWQVEARPSPVSAEDAARVARSEGATALLIDMAGPVRFVVETDDLEHMAAGHILVAAGAGHAWVSPRTD